MNKGYERDELILLLADAMIKSNYTLLKMEKMYKVSHSTTWWWIQNELPNLSKRRYNKCRRILEMHKHIRQYSK